MSHQVVRAGPEHLEQLAPLFDGYRQFYGQLTDLEGARRFLRERLVRNESAIHFVQGKNQAVGFIQLYPSFSSVAMRRLWIFNDLFVAPDARRGGVGRALLDVAAGFAKETGAKGMALTTAIDNGPAQRLYERTGWRRDHTFYTYTWEV